MKIRIAELASVDARSKAAVDALRERVARGSNRTGGRGKRARSVRK